MREAAQNGAKRCNAKPTMCIRSRPQFLINVIQVGQERIIFAFNIDSIRFKMFSLLSLLFFEIFSFPLSKENTIRNALQLP